MAYHRFQQFRYSLEQQVVELFGSILIGASGAVTTAKGGGILSVVKQTAAGQYLITLDNPYYRFLDFEAQVISASISQIVKIQVLQAPATFQADFQASNAFLIQLLGATSVGNPTLIAANAVSGEQVIFRATVRNTAVGPFD